MRIRISRENGSLALQPIIYIAGTSKLIHKDNWRMRSDYSYSPKIEILGVINRNLRIRIRGRILYFKQIPVNNS